jgi:hypothetical protein
MLRVILVYPWVLKKDVEEIYRKKQSGRVSLFIVAWTLA